MADQLLSTASRHNTLPEIYVRPEQQRPKLGEVASDDSIPLIDLSCRDRRRVVRQIAHACSSYGFFQVINHGVSKTSMQAMMDIAHQFFRLSPEEKASLYSDDPSQKVRLSTSFNVRRETFRNWRDYLRLHCYPLEEDIVSSYCKEVRELGFRLLGVISESLGLEQEYLVRVLGEQEQHMAINYYPPCPAPELTYGLPAHTDPNALTILLQDPLVAGLQVLKDGKWIRVDPHPHALVINMGDQLQALSNGRYKSVWHRAVVNLEKGRMSVASFLCPCSTVLISPPEKLIGEGSSAVYRNFTYAEYYCKFWSRNLDQEHCLELFKR